MKILHCSDLHLGRRPVGGIGEYSGSRFNDYFYSFHHIADYAVQNSVDTVIISGDIFDRREITPEILERAEQVFIKLKESGIAAVIAEGNHDRGGSNDSTWLNYLVHRKLVHMPSVTINEDNNYIFEPVVIDGIQFYSMGYPGIYIEEMSRSLVEVLDSEKSNIVLVHTAVSANDHYPGTVAPCVIDLFKGKALYIAGGHFHSYHQYPEKEPYFFVPGSPEYWDISERDDKFFIVFDTADGTHDKINTSRRKRIEIQHSFTSKSDIEFEHEFDSWLSVLAVEKDSVVICLFRIEDSLYPDGPACEKKIESAGALKAKVSFAYDRPVSDTGLLNEQAVTTESIELENFTGSGYSAETAVKIVNTYLPELKKMQIEDQSGDIAFELVDRMIEELIRGK
ncbi:MAG TPA: exonuclease SbcCD subunit D [Spirochaetota bacterium]|nr:exonuclease SbcCD subunit D [Spirochaetota bacterium]